MDLIICSVILAQMCVVVPAKDYRIAYTLIKQ